MFFTIRRNKETVQVHVEPPPILLMKSKNDEKLDKYSVKIKLSRDPTSEKLEIYEFKMAFFDNRQPGYFLLFIRNFNRTLKASGTLKYGTKVQCLRIMVRGEELHHFDTLYAEVGSDTSESLTSIVLGLGT